MSKLSQYLSDKKIDQRRVIAVSKKLEALRLVDRQARLARRLSRKEGGKPAPAGEKGRSGRPVTPVLLDKIVAGKAVPAAAKTRVLRAVNKILEAKKQTVAQFKELF